MRPNRIILVRHGESEGNVDYNIHANKPDHKLVLTTKGIEQAKAVGLAIHNMVKPKPEIDYAESLHIWASPYARTRLTARHLVSAFRPNELYRGKIFEDPRIREQERGNFQQQPEIKEIEAQRDVYGTFFYRFPVGESGADVYDRVSGFLESIFRDFQNPEYKVKDLVIVTHGLTMRLFLMRFLHESVEWFESLRNPRNCQFAVLELLETGKYYLAVPLENKRQFEREPPPQAE